MMSKEFSTTVRFPEKDWIFLEKLVKDGEFSTPSDVIRFAVREFRKKQSE